MAKDQDKDPSKAKPLMGRLPVGSWSHASRVSYVRDPRIGGNTCTKVEPAVDLVHSTEIFLLEDGEKKVEIEPETRAF